MAKDHPADYATCIAALPAAIASPTYAGQAPHHRANFEIVNRIAGAGGRLVLVAIGIEPDELGAYRVRTCYLIPASKAERRRRAGRLRVVPPESDSLNRSSLWPIFRVPKR